MTRAPVAEQRYVRVTSCFLCACISLFGCLSLSLSYSLSLSLLTLLLIVVVFVHCSGCHVCICRSLSLVISLSLSCMHTHTATLSLSSSTHSISLWLIAVFLSFFSYCVIVAHGIFIRCTLLPLHLVNLHLTVPPPHTHRTYSQYCVV